MRKYIDIITEAARETITSEQLKSYLTDAIGRKQNRFLAMVHGSAGDGARSTCEAACEAAGMKPEIISLGHSNVEMRQRGELVALAKKIRDHDGVTILDVNPHNIQMCLGEQGVDFMEQGIRGAKGQIIIVMKNRESPFSDILNDHFPSISLSDDTSDSDIADGGIHRVY